MVIKAICEHTFLIKNNGRNYDYLFNAFSLRELLKAIVLPTMQNVKLSIPFFQLTNALRVTGMEWLQSEVERQRLWGCQGPSYHSQQAVETGCAHV